MGYWHRIVSILGERRIIIALGALYVVLAAGRGLLRIFEGAELSSVVIVSIFIGFPGAILIYGGYRLPQTDIQPEFFATTASWSLYGFGLMLGILSLYNILATGGIANPDRSIPILTSLSTTAGFGVGINNARALTREHELDLRNQELQQTQLQLEETIEQLENSKQRLEESNMRLEKSNERLEQFAYAASHDLQEPLRMVSSYMQLIDSRYDDDLDEEGQEFLKYAVDGADRMREMIDGLLAYSRIETQGEPLESIELNAVLEDTLKDLQMRIEEEDAEITTDPLPRVCGDAKQLRRVFQNLLDNAIEYHGEEPPQIHVSAERNGTTWIISVSDGGIGIEPDDQERIFEVFQRLHNREAHAGSGIGLSLCQRIIERHGGEIWVDSEPSEGATFSFTLPTVDERD